MMLAFLIFLSSPFDFGWTIKQEGKKEGGLGEGIFALPYLRLRYFRFLSIKKRKSSILLKYMIKFLSTMRMVDRLIIKIQRIFLKKSSNFSQKAQPTFTFYKIITGFTGMLSLIMIFFRYNPGIFKITHQPVVGNAEVPALKLRENKVFLEPIFSLSLKAKDLSAFLFDCPKVDLKTI